MLGGRSKLGFVSRMLARRTMQYAQAFIVAGFTLVLVGHCGGLCGVVAGWVLGDLQCSQCDAKKVVQGSEHGMRGAPWQRSTRDFHFSRALGLDIWKHAVPLGTKSYCKMLQGPTTPKLLALRIWQSSTQVDGGPDGPETTLMITRCASQRLAASVTFRSQRDANHRPSVWVRYLKHP